MSEGATNTSVPKFGSFKPKVATKDNLRTSDEHPPKRRRHEVDGSELRGNHERNERHRRGYAEGDRKKKHHDRNSERPRSRERHMNLERPAPNLVDVDPVNDDLNTFVVDRKGDVKNIVYGSIHRYDVPPFRRFGAGCVLGCKVNIKIDREASDDKGLVLNSRRGGNSQREKYIFAKNEKKPVRLIKVRQDSAMAEQYDAEADFILLRRSRHTARSEDHQDENDISSDDGRNHYRSIEGKAKAKDYPFDEELEYATDATSDSDNGRSIKFDAAIRQKSIDLSRRVEQNPQDVEAWLALINHQDTLLGLDTRRKITVAERRSTADIKIHMYEKALQNISSQRSAVHRESFKMEDQERLLVGLMAEGSKIWDVKTLAKKWETISAEYLASSLLGKRYLDFQQSTFVTFKYEKVRDVFISRIDLLKQSIRNAGNDKEKSQSLLESLVYTILRASLFIRESGFSELATAIWQGLLELNMYTPNELQSQVAEKVVNESFKEFWESEVPRIGEEGSLGWHRFFTSPDGVDFPEPSTDKEVHFEPGREKSIFEYWQMAELSMAANSKKPARTMDEVTEDDPYRVILFNDIEPFMIFTSDSQDSAEAFQTLLIDAFLLFCQLPPFSKYGIQQSWWQDPFIRNDLSPASTCVDNQQPDVKSLENADLLQNPACAPESPIVIKDVFDVPCKRFATSSNTYFSGPHWIRVLDSWRNLQNNDAAVIDYAFVKSFMNSLAAKVIDVDYLEYYLSFMLENEPQDIKKICKGLLKRHSTSLRLYNAYGMIEDSRGNTNIATNTFFAALSMKGSVPENEQKDFVFLWHSLTWSALDHRDLDRALIYLLSIRDNTESFDKSMLIPSSVELVSPVAILKAKQHLNSNREYLLSTGSLLHAKIYAELCALLEYMTSPRATSHQGNITPAIASFRASITGLKARGLEKSYSSELLHQSAARLLSLHARLGPFRPALLRDQLTESIELFPNNTIFLSLFAWNESRLRIDDRVRTILVSTVLTEENDNFPARIFAIRYSMAMENVNSTRSAFENAVDSTSCKHNWRIWQMYILWCIRTKEFRHKAKDVFLRGLKAVPWAKELAMIAFTHLRDIMKFDELKDIYRVLGEKELRIHVDMDEQLEDLEDEMRMKRLTQ